MRAEYGQFEFDLRRRLLYYQWAVDAEWWDDHRQQGFFDYSPGLIAVFSNDYWLVDLPFAKSSDFEGEVGKLFLTSNWYDGPDWMQ